MSDYPVRGGDVFTAPDFDDAVVTVRRVARDGSWADIHVRQPTGATWTKRQPLVAGAFPFTVRARAGEPT